MGNPARVTDFEGRRLKPPPDDPVRESKAPNGAIWGVALVINQHLRLFGKGDFIGAKMVDLLWHVYDHSFTQAGFQYENGETKDAGLLCSFDLAKWALDLGWLKPFLSKKYREAIALGFLTSRPAPVKRPGDEARLILRWNHPDLWRPLQEDYQRAARTRHSRQGAGRPQEAGVNSGIPSCQQGSVNPGISAGVVIDITTRRPQEPGVNSEIITNTSRRYSQDLGSEISELTPGCAESAPGPAPTAPLRTTKKDTEEDSVTDVTGSVPTASPALISEASVLSEDKYASQEQTDSPAAVGGATPPTAELAEEIPPAPIVLADLDQPPTDALLASWHERIEAQRCAALRLRTAFHQAGIPIRTHRVHGQVLAEAQAEETRLCGLWEEERDLLAWMEACLRTAQRHPHETVARIEELARDYFEGRLEEPVEEMPEVEEPIQPPWPILSREQWRRALIARLFTVFDMDSKEANDQERGPIVRAATLLLQSNIRPEAVSNLKDHYEGLLSKNRRHNEPLPYYSPPAIAAAATSWKKACRKMEEEEGRYDQWGEAMPARELRDDLPTEPKRRRRRK